jgi:ribulose-phosphate 3-epimerase
MRDIDPRLAAPHCQLSVGITKANPLQLGAQLDQLAAAGAEVLHVDVMDGHFADPLTGGPDLVRALPEHFATDVHLMVDNPERQAEKFAQAGATAITFHPEATAHPHRLLRRLGRLGMTRGIALSPGTPIHVLEPLIGELEMVLVLAVNPGGGGETFHPNAYERLRRVRQLTQDTGVLVSIDGSITMNILPAVMTAEPDLIVAGSAVFSEDDPAAATRGLLDQLDAPRGPATPSSHQAVSFSSTTT